METKRSTRKASTGTFLVWLILLTEPESATAFTIGFLYPQKDSSWVVESFSQFRLAVKRINENQRKRPSFPTLQFIAYDSRGDSLTAVKGAVKLIETDHCNVLIGPGYSAEIPAASAFASVCRLHPAKKRARLASCPDNLPVRFTGTTSSNHESWSYICRVCGQDAVSVSAANGRLRQAAV
jgi:hypothetical protein